MKIRKIVKETLNKIINEKIITPPNIPNTLNFWHGGNLNEYNETIAQKNGRYEYGAGLYLTSYYDIAKKYAKGSRKLYLITVEIGNDINDSLLPINDLIEFINQYVITNKRKEIIEILQKYNKNGFIKGNIFNNIILNQKAIKSVNTQYLREFYIKNNIDYEIVDNAFGYHENMMVLYNMKKIKNIIRVESGDKIETFDLKS
jgi:hypothetical protein